MADTDIDMLEAWAAKSDADLEGEYDKHDSELLGNLIGLLGDSKLRAKTIAKQDFVPTVRQLQELVRSGSRALGHALNEAGEYKDSGHAAKASEILETFIRTCPSKFYRDIARNYIERYLK